MRKLLLAAAAVAALAAPAAARDGQPYIGIEGGVLFANDTDFDVTYDDGTGATEYEDALSINYDTGYDIDAIIGYDFGMFRLEGELAYKRASVDDVEFSSAFAADLGAALGLGGPADASDVDVDDEKVGVTSGMVNALLDFGDDDGISFYAGGGLGRAGVKLFDDKDSAWAYQLIAGARTAISDNIDLGLKYRYFRTGKLDFDDDFDGESLGADGRFSSHSLLASLIFNFGGRDTYVAPPPPPPAPVVEPAPAPVQPATQTCPDGSVILATDVCPAPPQPAPVERG